MKEGQLYRLVPEASTFAHYARSRHGYLWLCFDAPKAAPKASALPNAPARFKSVATGAEHTFYNSEMEEEG